MRLVYRSATPLVCHISHGRDETTSVHLAALNAVVHGSALHSSSTPQANRLTRFRVGFQRALLQASWTTY